MGKSTAADLLRQHGIAVIDTDQIARDLVEPGRPALAEIEQAFGRGILLEGRLHRAALARLVFQDAESRRRLEGILHPRIRAAWQEQAQRWRTEGRSQAAVVIPLLFETKAGPFDAVICVACSASTQQARLRARGWSAEQLAQRIEAQWPVERKIALSDFVVWTDTSLAAHEEQWRRIARW